MRLTFTPTLRNDDVGMMVIGMVHGIVVPPQPDGFRVIAYCHSSCTKQVMLHELVIVLLTAKFKKI